MNTNTTHTEVKYLVAVKDGSQILYGAALGADITWTTYITQEVSEATMLALVEEAKASSVPYDVVRYTTLYANGVASRTSERVAGNAKLI
jgi:hypothetical protein